MDDSILVCEECGGDNIVVKMWMDANNYECLGYTRDGDGNRESGWCSDCNEEVNFVSEAEFELALDEKEAAEGVQTVELLWCGI